MDDASAADEAVGGGAAAARTAEAAGTDYHKLLALLETSHKGWRRSLEGGPWPNAEGHVGWVRKENRAKWAASHGKEGLGTEQALEATEMG